VLAETRAQLGLDVAALSIQPVIFPLDGTGVWAYDVRLSDRRSTADIRAYVRESDLTLLYAQDVACAAVFAEGRVFAGNPGRSPQAQGVRLRGLRSPEAALSTTQLKAEQAVHCARAHVQVDAVQGPYAGEGLGDAGHRQEIWSHAGPPCVLRMGRRDRARCVHPPGAVVREGGSWFVRADRYGLGRTDFGWR
jgi:hypothetical protein